jgi:hypothetical protein
MTTTYAYNGQSILDVALNTYGTLDKVVKLASDNGVTNLLTYPTTRQAFVYDETQASVKFSKLISPSVTYAPIASLFANGYGRLVDYSGGYCVDAKGYYCAQYANGAVSSIDTTSSTSLVDFLTSDFLSSDFR